ncbi:type 1 glutamine amidotransferase [Fundidesulfovibrio agrisoli]|uniref:type 1 glutamine amidotransferase n=1 Tax=Fundidesulfovibrio agrisoli TaxID=2922717 RepID=UPI001FAE44D0|nr:type 1 glutamine amidotransferase [Fundidesulfovibrio agrisoli]
MLIRTFEHEPFEGPANIEAWAAKRGHTMVRTFLHAGDALPQAPDYDMLVVMGGGMSVHDELQFPWMREEKECLKQAVARGRSVLGVCLGAQMLSEALGGFVTPGLHREIGWHPVRLTPWAAGSPAFAGLPKSFMGFHWHGETFSIPRGATLLAESDACAHQAFAVGAKLVGVQFHFETTLASMEQFLAGAGDDLGQGGYVQTAEQMREGAALHMAALEAMLFRLLDNMAREI